MSLARRSWAAGVGWVALGLAGCPSSQTTVAVAPPAGQGLNLVVAAVGEPSVLETVVPHRDDWNRQQGGTFTIGEGTLEPSAVGKSGADVVLFPAERLGDLVDTEALAVLPESVVRPSLVAASEGTTGSVPTAPRPMALDPLDFADVLPAFRDQVTKYGADRMGLPFGGSALVLFYRRDAFLNAANRDAAQAAGLELKPPTTWEEFRRLNEFFQGRDWDGDGQPESALAAALGPDAEGLGEATLLARAAGPGQHGDQFSFLFDADTMAPRIDAPPFAEAMAALVHWKRYGPPGMERFDAEAARKAFQAGETVFLIDRAERAGRGANAKAPIPTGVAPLPGSSRVFEPDRKVWEDRPEPNRPSYLPGGGGWLVGVSSALKEPRLAAAIALARYLAGPEVSARVRSNRAVPMLPTRGAQVGSLEGRSAPGVEPRLWGQAVTATLTSPPASRVIPGLRIPEASGYLADLGLGRVSAIGGTPAAEALGGVAKAWAERTDRLGRDRQLWHYRRSLNGPDTSAVPPAR